MLASSFETRFALLRMRVWRRSKVTDGAFLYILRCIDGSFYIGVTRAELEIRIAQHNAGTLGGHTSTRRPVMLVYSQWFDRITDAIENERKLKKWTRAKKEVFIRGDWVTLRQLRQGSRRIDPRPPIANFSMFTIGLV